jgi:hypothetical protein
LNSPYRGNNTCVTFPEFITHNYTDRDYNWDNKGKVYPENYCYGMLSYNISREDFSDIINKNLHAFSNYRRMADLLTIFDSGVSGPSDDCAGIIRNIVCWAEFPACMDKGTEDFTWVSIYV